MAKGIQQTVFGRRLRDARLRADIPQDRLGVQIGLDETVASARISRYETGIHEPAFDTAVRLALALNVPTAYFYCENDELANLVLAWDAMREPERNDLWALIEAQKMQRAAS
jgi:transcriptional regulator with XRE-family HTH domain